MKTMLENGEMVVLSQKANRMGKAGVAFNGTLYFTNMRMIFETSSINSAICNVTDKILYSDILKYMISNNTGICNMIPIPGVTKDKCITIITATERYNYLPQKLENVLQLLEQACGKEKFAGKESHLNTLKSNLLGK